MSWLSSAASFLGFKSGGDLLMFGLQALGLGKSIYDADQAKKSMEDLEKEQEEQLALARSEQMEADYNAETKRLEALAAEQTGGSRVEASDFGIDSALARRYLDENNKRQAKAQQMLEEEENPFYTRGLV